MPFLGEDGLIARVETKLHGWNKSLFARFGVSSLYAFLCAMTLAPIVEAARSGNIDAYPLLLALFGNVGANLITNVIQNWKDEVSAAREIQSMLNDPIKRRKILTDLDTMLQKYEVLQVAGRSLSPDDKKWYVTTIQQELIQLGNWDKHAAQLLNAGIIQGNRTIQMGDGSQYIENPHDIDGNFYGPSVKKKGEKND